MPGGMNDASHAADATLESDESDTFAANDSKIVLDAPLWRHWPGSLSFSLMPSGLCCFSCQPACLPAFPNLGRGLPVRAAR